jgi:hypothetical protein
VTIAPKLADAAPDAEGFVTLVPRDPDWALALWELGADAVGRARAQLTPPLEQSEMQLRVYPMGDGAGGQRRPVRTYRISRWSGQRLVLIERPGVSHQAAIGFVDVQGAFVPVVRSAIIPTPLGGFGANGPDRAEEPERE